jgi:hypothetical protein
MGIKRRRVCATQPGRVFIGGIPRITPEEAISRFSKSSGHLLVSAVQPLVDATSGAFRGAAYVDVTAAGVALGVDAAAAGVTRAVKELNGLMWKGSRLRVEPAEADYKARLEAEWAAVRDDTTAKEAAVKIKDLTHAKRATVAAYVAARVAKDVAAEVAAEAGAIAAQAAAAKTAMTDAFLLPRADPQPLRIRRRKGEKALRVRADPLITTAAAESIRGAKSAALPEAKRDRARLAGTLRPRASLINFTATNNTSTTGADADAPPPPPPPPRLPRPSDWDPIPEPRSGMIVSQTRALIAADLARAHARAEAGEDWKDEEDDDDSSEEEEGSESVGGGGGGTDWWFGGSGKGDSEDHDFDEDEEEEEEVEEEEEEGGGGGATVCGQYQGGYVIDGQPSALPPLSMPLPGPVAAFSVPIISRKPRSEKGEARKAARAAGVVTITDGGLMALESTAAAAVAVSSTSVVVNVVSTDNGEDGDDDGDAAVQDEEEKVVIKVEEDVVLAPKRIKVRSTKGIERRERRRESSVAYSAALSAVAAAKEAKEEAAAAAWGGGEGELNDHGGDGRDEYNMEDGGNGDGDVEPTILTGKNAKRKAKAEAFAAAKVARRDAHTAAGALAAAKRSSTSAALTSSSTILGSVGGGVQKSVSAIAQKGKKTKGGTSLLVPEVTIKGGGDTNSLLPLVPPTVGRVNVAWRDLLYGKEAAAAGRSQLVIPLAQQQQQVESGSGSSALSSVKPEGPAGVGLIRFGAGPAAPMALFRGLVTAHSDATFKLSSLFNVDLPPIAETVVVEAVTTAPFTTTKSSIAMLMDHEEDGSKDVQTTTTTTTATKGEGGKVKKAKTSSSPATNFTPALALRSAKSFFKKVAAKFSASASAAPPLGARERELLRKDFKRRVKDATRTQR